MRYLRILFLFFKTSVMAEAEYRLNFLLSALTSVGNAIGGLFALSFFYRNGGNLGGWSWNDVIVVLGVFTVVEGFSQSVLNPNLNRIVEHVQKGTLDFILLKPIDSQFWLSTRHISLWGLPSVLSGVVLVLYGVMRTEVSPTNLLWGTGLLLVGLVILYSLWFMLGTLSVWFVKIYNVTYVLKAVVEGGRFPITAYPVLYRFFMTFIVPVAFLTTIPAETFLGRGRLLYTVAGVLLALVFFVLSRVFWRFALRFYTSASS